MQLIGSPSTVVVVNPSTLKEHPKNAYYFPEVSVNEDEKFLESIRSRGIISMPIISEDGVIISGHRRVRAAIKCGFDQVRCQQRHYDNEDMMLYDLLASNVMSRGGLGALYAISPVKASRVTVEFARLYGNLRDYNGSNESPIGEKKTRGEMVDDLGISRTTVCRALTIGKVNDNVADALDGHVSAGAIERVGQLLNEDQQRMLLKILPENYDKLTTQQFQCVIDTIIGYADEIKVLNEDMDDLEKKLERQVRKVTKLEEMNAPNANLDEEITRRQEAEVERNKLRATVADLRIRLSKAEREQDDLQSLHNELESAKQKIEELESREPETVEVEVVPDDYYTIKEENETLHKKILNLTKMDSVAGFAMANIQSLKDLAAGVDSPELNTQMKQVETAMHGLVDCVTQLKSREREAAS